MAKTQNKKRKTDNQATVTSVAPAPGHLQITVSGPAEHVMAALTSMNFQRAVTPLLCQQIAIAETNVPDAKVSDQLGSLNMLSPQSRTAYTQRCTLDLKAQTGYNIDPTKLPQDSDTTVQQVAEAMYDATT
jgi:hypothetical protein